MHSYADLLKPYFSLFILSFIFDTKYQNFLLEKH